MLPIILIGPTASGKSALALALAQRIGGEIICCDARQIYREADIITAKPSRLERDAVPHHLVDICDPNQPFSALQWAEQARQALVDIEKRGRRAIICGGTGFYLRALLEPDAFDAPESHPELRAALDEWARGVDEAILQAALEFWAPESVNRFAPTDLFRRVRALEVALLRKHPLLRTFPSPTTEIHFDKSPFNVVTEELISRVPKTENVLERTQTINLSKSRIYGLSWERNLLYERINSRVEAMIEAGAELEAQTLREKWGEAAPFASGVGYKHLWAFVDEEMSREKAIEAWKRDSRRYAKRQTTWFRHQIEAVWLDAARGADALTDEIEAAPET